MAINSSLKDLLDGGRFVVSAELTPPRGWDLSAMLEHAARMGPHVDVVQLNDQLLSNARLCTLVAAHKVHQLGLEPVLQFALRHRNRIAVQSDLLGMAALGLQNLIVLGGYPIAIGSDPGAVDATDLNPVEALRLINRLSTIGALFNGDPLPKAPDFYPGTIEIPCTSEADIPKSLEKLAAKIEAGAHYIQVQAVFDLMPMQRWMKAVVACGLHRRAYFIAAVFPFSGSERLKFLQKVPGLYIPDHLIERVSREGGEAAAFDITLELIRGILEIDGLRGLHLRSIGAESWVPELLERAGLTKAERAPQIGFQEVGALS
jgi:methylenetetrahydrofolate reductase (NADPH)